MHRASSRWPFWLRNIGTIPETHHADFIGALLPFSGGVELYGRQAQVGLDLAASEIKASGSILGHPVEIIYENDGTRLGTKDTVALICSPVVALRS